MTAADTSRAAPKRFSLPNGHVFYDIILGLCMEFTTRKTVDGARVSVLRVWRTGDEVPGVTNRENLFAENGDNIGGGTGLGGCCPLPGPRRA